MYVCVRSGLDVVLTGMKLHREAAGVQEQVCMYVCVCVCEAGWT